MAKIKYKTRVVIRSFTDHSKQYKIKEKEDGSLSCNCPCWIFNQRGDRTCKHIDAIKEAKDPLEQLLFMGGKTLKVDGEDWELIEGEVKGNEKV